MQGFIEGTIQVNRISLWSFEEARLQNIFLQILILRKLITLAAKDVRFTRGCSKHGLTYKETLIMPLRYCWQYIVKLTKYGPTVTVLEEPLQH
jgi:hypothetical protein